MLSVDELRSLSGKAKELLSISMEARANADLISDGGDRGLYGNRFVDQLFALERAASEYNDAITNEAAEMFSAVCQQPFSWDDAEFAPSVHGAVRNLGMRVGEVAYAVVDKGLPGYYEPGVEYILPRLVAKEDIVKHLDIAVSTFASAFPNLNRLNEIYSLLQQECARAIGQIDIASGSATSRSAAPPNGNGKQGRDLPTVNLGLSQVRYQGQVYDVTGEAARLMDLLVAADDWISASSNGFSKPSEIKDSLPGPLRDLIETDRGKGYRIKRL